MARADSGHLTALLITVTTIGALIPLWRSLPLALGISAAIFGNSFFAVVSSMSAFARLNYPAGEWPKAIATITVAFDIGQTCGPIATGGQQKSLA
jgi:hypothetical protein